MRDAEAFRAIFERELAFVIRALQRFGVAAGDVEDLAQEVFVAVHQHRDRFDSSRPVRPWLLAFVHRIAANYARLARHRADATDSIMVQADNLLEFEGSRLRDALMRLTFEERALIALCDLEELPLHEAAQVAGLSQRALPKRLAAARARLREEFYRAKGAGRA